jgi:hypothetical protein
MVRHMEENGSYFTEGISSSRSVQREVVGFFRTHPFLLVSESRLASLLCRPPEMVCEAVKVLEEEGLLTRRYGEALWGVEESLAKVEN